MWSRAVLKGNNRLAMEEKIPHLAVKLASVFFVKCMAMGCKRYPALPTVELTRLKQVNFDLFPKLEGILWEEDATIYHYDSITFYNYI